MIIALLGAILILLLPGGAPFLMRLCSGALILMGLGIAYAFWGTVAVWIIGSFAAFIAGAFGYALINELSRPRKRFLSGGR
jgi:hypothetical protein